MIYHVHIFFYVMIEFPERYSVLVIGPPGVGKFEYFLTLVKEFLKNREKVVFITTEHSPTEIIERLKIDINKEDIVFIDLYSYSSQKKFFHEKNLIVDNPANLNLITLNIEKAKKIIGTPMRIFFDSLSTLFLYSRESEINRFFTMLISRVKTQYGSIFCSLQKGMHDEKIVAALKHAVDCVIEMEFEEVEGETLRKMRIFYAKGIKYEPNWMFYKISDSGIIFKEKEEKIYVKKRISRKVIFAALISLLFIFSLTFLNFTKENEFKEKKEIKEIIGIRGIKVLNVIDSKAPNKGWLVISTKYYNISINLDKSYYMLYDNLNKKNVLIYNDTVENPTDMLTGSDFGFADYDGNNKVPFSTTALHDKDGLEYEIVSYSEDKGYVLIKTYGWDFKSLDISEGYDVEAESYFLVFSEKPYYIEAVKLYNLQTLGYAPKIEYRNPDAVVKTWVIRGDYEYLTIRGGDYEHLNKILWMKYYKLQRLGNMRKLFHAGSASFAPMFPDHILIGDKLDGGIIFSLPKGKFRYREELGARGDQIALEFVLSIEKPEKAVAFALEPVSTEAFFYDIEEFHRVKGYKESMQEICKRYGIEDCPEEPLDAHEWDVKMFAVAVSLVKDWYSPEKNDVKEDAIKIAESALKDFYIYEDLIYNAMVGSKPLVAKAVV